VDSAIQNITDKQGQYLAFIHAYSLAIGRPPAEAAARQSGWEGVLPHPEMLPRLTGCLSQNAPAQFILFIGLMRTRCG
jgi:hypothetical protein